MPFQPDSSDLVTALPLWEPVAVKPSETGPGAQDPVRVAVARSAALRAYFTGYQLGLRRKDAAKRQSDAGQRLRLSRTVIEFASAPAGVEHDAGSP